MRFSKLAYFTHKASCWEERHIIPRSHDTAGFAVLRRGEYCTPYLTLDSRLKSRLEARTGRNGAEKVT